jgi:hypothetical protein
VRVARDLSLTPSALGKWVERALADQGKGKPRALTTEVRTGWVCQVQMTPDDYEVGLSLPSPFAETARAFSE